MLETVKPLTVRERIQWGVLQGLPHRIATSPSAHHHLQTALELAKPHRYLATILEQGRGIGPLLLSPPAVGTLRSYADMLAMAAQTSGRRTRKRGGGRAGRSVQPGAGCARTAVQPTDHARESPERCSSLRTR